MAMPTEEKRVVKKVVVQADWTKKIIKKIIRKVPKKEWESQPAATAETSAVLAWENLETPRESSVSLDDVSDLFGNPDNQTNVSNENNPQTENQVNDVPTTDQTTPVAESQSEAQDAWTVWTIDLWSFDFSDDSQTPSQNAEPQQEVAPVEAPAWVATMDMDSLLSDSSENNNTQSVENASEPQITNENLQASNDNQMFSQPQDSVEQPQQAVEQPQQAVAPVEEAKTEEAFDPFLAMKTTLEESNDAPATLDLDSMVSQPEAQPEQVAAPVPQPEVQPAVQQVEAAPLSDVPTLNLDAMPSQTWTLPPMQNQASPALTNAGPLAWNIMQNLWGLKLDAGKKNILTIAASCFWVLVLAAIVFIRYPDMFAWGTEEHGAPTIPTTTNNNWNQWGTVDSQQPTNDWNNGQNTTDTQNEWTTDTQDIQPTQNIEVIKPKEPIVITWENFFDDEDIPTVELDEVSISIWNTGAVDPLWEVSWLVGSVSGGDTIKQEATEYVQKWKELKDMWAAQNNRNKMRYWTFIEWKANEVLEGLEKGQNIDISSWISLKAQFDEYLKKGTDA